MTMLALCALVQSAAAQTVYKCTVDGKVSYREQPCAEGKTTPLTVPPPPPGADKAAAASLARNKARLAAVEKERSAAAAREEREGERAARAEATARSKCDRLRLQQKWAQEDVARAGREATEAQQIKARRQAEALAVQCPG
ncbi:hypothetical protein ASF77_06465 [Massilia sp. Leaf139]|nr:hypothetical protein ASF77_06465 [Massilia sp. Leaf139]